MVKGTTLSRTKQLSSKKTKLATLCPTNKQHTDWPTDLTAHKVKRHRSEKLKPLASLSYPDTYEYTKT